MKWKNLKKSIKENSFLLKNKMKNIIDYREKIKEFTLVKRKFSAYEIEFPSNLYSNNLTITITKGNPNEKDSYGYTLEVQGNKILGYNLLFSGIINLSLDGGLNMQKDFSRIEEIVLLNEDIAKELDFDYFTVKLRDEFHKQICKNRNYEIEEERDSQVAVKTFKKKK